jgi:hypothetical protein
LAMARTLPRNALTSKSIVVVIHASNSTTEKAKRAQPSLHPLGNLVRFSGNDLHNGTVVTTMLDADMVVKENKGLIHARQTRL